MKHIIAVLIENEAGALSRVVGLFSARAYNIESLTVAPTEDDHAGIANALDGCVVDYLVDIGRYAGRSEGDACD